MNKKCAFNETNEKNEKSRKMMLIQNEIKINFILYKKKHYEFSFNSLINSYKNVIRPFY